MVESFPKTLSGLRKEKNISQKEAAASLGISQALLSHYENGLREPGLEFAVHAAKYYGVTTDYLLGVSGEKLHPAPAVSRARESVSQTPKRLAVNSLSLLYEAVGHTGSQKFAEEFYAAVSIMLYRLYRLFSRGAKEPLGDFAVPERLYDAFSDAEYHRTEARLAAIIEKETALLPVVDRRTVREAYPVYEPSVEATLKLADERVKKQMEL